MIFEDVRQLFEFDDGSLPDIYIEPLRGEDVIQIYARVVAQAGIYNEPTAWSRVEEKDVSLKELIDPARMAVEGEIEPFRHGLVDLIFDNVKLPDLTICVEPNAVSFDYRMGAFWGSEEVCALFAFLWDLVRDLPEAKVFHAFEGAYATPTEGFTLAWERYVRERRTRSSATG